MSLFFFFLDTEKKPTPTPKKPSSGKKQMFFVCKESGQIIVLHPGFPENWMRHGQIEILRTRGLCIWSGWDLYLWHPMIPAWEGGDSPVRHSRVLWTVSISRGLHPECPTLGEITLGAETRIDPMKKFTLQPSGLRHPCAHAHDAVK